MSEASFIELFIVLRGCLLGGFLLLWPAIVRKGLLFGVYVGEAVADGEGARALRKRWNLASVLLTLAAVAVGLAVGATGRPMVGTFASIGVFALVTPLLNFRFHALARPLAPPAASRQAQVAVALLDAEPARGETFARVSLVLTTLAGLGLVLHAAETYGSLPAQVPAWYGWAGGAEASCPRSLGSVMVPAALALVLGPFLAGFGLLAARAKRSFRGGQGGGSAEAQTAFRAGYSRLFSGTALFFTAFLGTASVEFLRLARHRTDSIGPGILIVSIPTLLFMARGLYRLLFLHGQGGSRVEQGSVAAPLTNGLVDDGHWLWGLLYVNREEPSILVEKRFGLGYTMNFGNPRALLLLGIPAILTVALLLVAVLSAGG